MLKPPFRGCRNTLVLATLCSLSITVAILNASANSKVNNHKQQIALAEDVNENYANENHLISGVLKRLKRQQQSSFSGSTSSSSSGGNSNNANSQAAANSGEQNSPDVTNGNQEDKSQEETLSNLKCDFGTSDSPDLCKFKILDFPLGVFSQAGGSQAARGLASNNWSHGSGKLALFQGGPLIDASDRNDTTGGYIFYETSNPYVTTVALNQSASGNNHHVSIFENSRTSPTSGSHQHDHSSTHMGSGSAGDYSSAAALFRSMHPMNQQQPFQQVLSSARVNVVGGGGGGGGGGHTFPAGGSSLPGPALLSPNLTAPGPSGMCLSFKYAIQGLSAEELRIYVNDHKTERSRHVWAASESVASNWTKGEVLYSVTNVHSLMFAATSLSSSSSSSGAIKDLQQRKFRGYIALDEIEINKHDPAGSEGPCRGHCNFDGDLCGWTNAENGQEDDFDWTFGRGSDNLFTGPARDYTSSTNNELTGGYLQTESGYPRRPGDRATLVSPMFQPTAVNDAMCMRLAVHMFGSGIGSLAIKIRYADQELAAPPTGGANQPPGGAPNQPNNGAPPVAAKAADGKVGANDLVIWEMSGDAGNNWHQAQTSVSSSKSPFQVVIEGVIGENHLGNIAIDEISFSSGPCPTSPPVASKNYGDCTFEQSMCYWRNPDADIHLDDLDWIRSADEQSIHGPNFDHTLKRKSGSYLKLENTFREPKSGSRAFLLSPIFQPKPGVGGSVQCLSFFYYMFMRSISSSGPNLGTIRVYLASNNELVPIWRLTNPISSPNWKHGRASLSTALVDGQAQAPTKLFQIAFEGIWGDAPGGAIALDDITVFDGACDIMPPDARSVPGECTFDVDMCSWTNKTSDEPTSSDSTDSTRSPFIQSVNSAQSSLGRLAAMQGANSNANKRISWQLATIDSRPVNLQDHTYKAPIGYAYVDVLDNSAQMMSFILQSSESTVQSGVQVSQCLSFWFAAFGRQDANQLNVYLTQASAPPPDDGSQPTRNSPSASQAGPANGAAQGPPNAGANAASPSTSSSGGAAAELDSENANAWKAINGKLLWSVSLRNMTETNRRKWQYGQVALKADSNYIVRFIAVSNDGGFALDDVSYYEGSCETRPAVAKIPDPDEADQGAPPAQPSKTAS